MLFIFVRQFLSTYWFLWSLSRCCETTTASFGHCRPNSFSTWTWKHKVCLLEGQWKTSIVFCPFIPTLDSQIFRNVTQWLKKFLVQKFSWESLWALKESTRGHQPAVCCIKTCIYSFKLEPKLAQRHLTCVSIILLALSFPLWIRRFLLDWEYVRPWNQGLLTFLKCQNFSCQSPAVTICPLCTVDTKAINYWIWIGTSRIFEILSHHLCPGRVVYFYLWVSI